MSTALLLAALYMEASVPRLEGMPLVSVTGPLLWSLLCIRSEREWPWLVALFVASSLLVPWVTGLPAAPLPLIAIEVGQAVGLTLLIRHLFVPGQLARSGLALLGYVSAVATLLFFGAIFAGAVLDSVSAILIWWLRDLCGYVALAGPMWYLASRKSAGVLADLGSHEQIGKLLALSALLLVTMIPLLTLWSGWDAMAAFHHLELAALVLPLPVAVVMADMFLGLGSAIAMALIAPIAIETANRSSGSATEVLPLLLFTYVFLTVLSITLFLVSSRRRQLIASLEATRHAMSMQNRFFSRMNHELRTPLNAILGFSELQQMRCACSSRNGYASNIHASGQKLLAMVEGAIDHGIVGTGALRKRHVELGPRVQSVASLLTDPRLIVNCEIDCSELESLHLEADPDVLDSIFLALLAPARRACGPLTTVRLSSRVEGANFVIEVSHENLYGWCRDQLEQAEWEIARRGALAHGARLVDRSEGGRVVRTLYVYAVVTA